MVYKSIVLYAHHVVCYLLCLLALIPSSALALSDAELHSIYNDTVWYNANGDVGGGASTTPPTTCSTTLVGSTNAEQVWNFFIGKGLSATQTAGIMGNMQHESGIEPQRLQGTSPSTITPAETFSGSLGWGIVQWTPGSKMIDTFSPKSGANTLSAQLDFLWGQLSRTGALAEDPRILQDIKSITDGDLRNAVLAFQGDQQVGGRYYGFERPADESGSVSVRLTFAGDFFRLYSGTTAPSSGGTGNTTCTGGDSGDGSSAPANPTGYAYPVAPLKQSGGDMPAEGHAAPVYAYDFIRPGGAPVYAIHSGVVFNSDTFYQDVPGCFRINLSADDGYKYWYGHLQNKLVRNGDRVAAGQQIAEVARDELGPVCHGRSPDQPPASHLHLDRGYPAGTNGGGTEPRNDPNFIPLLQTLYKELPN